MQSAVSPLEARASHLEDGAISHESSVSRSAQPSGSVSKRVGAKIGSLSSARRWGSGDKRRNRTSEKQVRNSGPHASVRAWSSMSRSSRIACWARVAGRSFRSAPARKIDIHPPGVYFLSGSELPVLFGAEWASSVLGAAAVLSGGAVLRLLSCR
jgi:hypothetical protein